MNTEDEEFERIEREIKMRQVPDAIHHTDPGETLEYIQGWNDCRQAMLAEQPAQQEPVLQEIEQYRLQMAAICTAAIGYWREGDGIQPDYDTSALRDVAKLYAKYERAMAAAQLVRADEREACALLCDQSSDSLRDLQFGDAIRERGQA